MKCFKLAAVLMILALPSIATAGPFGFFNRGMVCRGGRCYSAPTSKAAPAKKEVSILKKVEVPPPPSEPAEAKVEDAGRRDKPNDPVPPSDCGG